VSKELDRRALLKLTSGLGALAALGIPASVLAQSAAKGLLTIAYPTDVPTWDPNARALAAVQSLYKAIFDQPLTQNPDITVKPAVVTKWGFVDDKGLALGLDLRPDVTFHDGSKMTAEDFRYSFFERSRLPVPEGGRKLDSGFIWRRIKDIEIVSPTRLIIYFSEPMPSAIAWLYFLTSYIVPKTYIEKVGLDEFQKKPIGSGPYKLIEYQQGARIVLEAHDGYWGGKVAIPRVTIELVRDPTARVASIESRRVDVALDVPIREALRLEKLPGLIATIDSTADITLLQITANGGFRDDRARLAAHHAINKEALSKAFFNGVAKSISVPAAHNTPGYPEDYTFPFSEEKAIALLKEMGHGPQNPLNIKFSTSSGAFPSDFDVARALVQMWKKVGINAELEVIELSTYQERLRARTLPEATLFSWGNAAGDPEMYGGYLLDPKSIFSAFKTDDLAPKFQPLLVEMDERKRLESYKAAHRYAAEKGYTIPLYQTVKSIVHQKGVATTKYDNGFVLPQGFSFKT
jgi:peptide/nickel transport system substrate-binding protein